MIPAGFVGIALGSTATTLAIMAAVATQYGRSQKPFVIVPLACGIFVDIINSALIALAAMVKDGLCCDSEREAPLRRCFRRLIPLVGFLL